MDPSTFGQRAGDKSSNENGHVYKPLDGVVSEILCLSRFKKSIV